jgi:flavin-dependent dehydrogenase
MSELFDVVIVGARCAGSPLATMLARRGLEVAVIEQATFPRSTLSSHCVQADSLAFLNRLGVLDRIRGTGAPFMSRTDTRLEDFRMVEDFPQRAGDVGGAACVRRQTLDPILGDAAMAAGASMRMGTRVTGLLTERGRVAGVRTSEGDLRARLVVGADGRTSTVATNTGARKYNVTTNERRYYWTYFAGADLSGTPTFVFHRWGDRHIFAAPTDDGLYLVGVSPQRHEHEQFRADLDGSVMRHVRSCQPVARVLANARRASKIYGILRFEGYFREPSGPGWVLVGDAGHFKDPAAGRGIGDAFRQVETLVPRIVAGLRQDGPSLDASMAEWGRWRDRAYHEYYWLAADIGRAGPLRAVVPAVIERLHRRGQAHRFLDLFSHRTGPSDVLTPAGILAGAVDLACGRTARADLHELGSLLALQTRRIRLARRPVFANAGPAEVQAFEGGTRHVRQA